MQWFVVGLALEKIGRTILGGIFAGFIKKCFDLTVELVKHISRLLQSVKSARIIAQNFLFDGGR